MADGTADRRLERQKLGDADAVRELLDMLSVGPPSIPVNLLDVGVRTLEGRNILPHPIP